MSKFLHVLQCTYADTGPKGYQKGDNNRCVLETTAVWYYLKLPGSVLSVTPLPQ